jgi:hypothetical protein
MDTIEYQKTCTLCGLAVEIEGFSYTTQKGLLSFCCAGCLSIYQLLNDDNVDSDDNVKTPLTIQP